MNWHDWWHFQPLTLLVWVMPLLAPAIMFKFVRRGLEAALRAVREIFGKA